MKFRLLALLILFSIGASAQRTWTSYGSNGIQRSTVPDTLFRSNGGAFGYVYWRSEYWNANHLSPTLTFGNGLTRTGNNVTPGGEYTDNIYIFGTNKPSLYLGSGLGSGQLGNIALYDGNKAAEINVSSNSTYAAASIRAINTTTSANSYIQLKSNGGGIEVYDGLSFKGMKYLSDYSKTWVDADSNYLATKGYVDIKTPYVTPEQYGAVGDGVTDDATAIRNAANSGKLVRLASKSYYIGSAIQMPLRSSIRGNGISSLILTGGDYNAFEVTGYDVSISDIGILGTGKGGTPTNNNGIFIQGNYPTNIRSSIVLSNIRIGNFSNAGIKQVGTTNGGYFPTIIASNVTSIGNNIGIELGVRAEYNSFTNCVFDTNNTGVLMYGGNNNFVGGQINGNVDGVTLAGGENDGHSVMTGVAINHNTSNAIKTDGLAGGYLFDACMMYGGGNLNDILLINSLGIKFTDCDLGATNVKTANSSVEFLNNKWVITPTFTDNFGSGGYSTIRYFNNYFKAGGQPSSIQSTLKEPLTVERNLTVNTGNTYTADLPNQTNGSINFANNGGGGLPTILGKSNDRTGLTVIAATIDANADPDFVLNVRKNDNTDFTTLTNTAFRFSRFGTGLVDILRNGSLRSYSNDGNANTVPRNSDVTTAITPVSYTEIQKQTQSNWYGDSYVDLSNSWVSPALQFKTATGLKVNNYGVSGQTTTQIKARFDALGSYADMGFVIEGGRNDIDINGAILATATTIKANIAAMVATLTGAGNTKYLILGVIPKNSETCATTGGIFVTQLNADLLALYPNNFVPMSAAVQAANDGSANDLADIANCIMPRSKMFDAIHLNTAGYAVYSQQIINKLAILMPDAGKYITLANVGGIIQAGQKTLQTGTGGSVVIGDYKALTLPDQNTTQFANTLIVGNGAKGIAHTTGAEGQGNTIVGMNAATNGVFKGLDNAIVGVFAGYNLTSGSNNMLLGNSSGLALTTGGNNQFIGSSAGRTTLAGISNTAIGTDAFRSNASGNQNVAIGQNSSYFSTGNNNVSVGVSAFQNFTAGSANTAIGEESLKGTSNTSNNNTGLGYQSGFAITTGNSNILMGYRAGDALTSGSKNIIIGSDADAQSNTASSQVNIGNVIWAQGASATGTAVAGTLGLATLPTTTSYATLPASTTTVSSLNIPSGTAPTAPVNGDTWKTAVAEFHQVNGVTKQVAYTSDITSQVVYQTAGTSATLSSTGRYIPQNASLTVYTLPTTANVGDVIFINGKGAGGWKIAQNTGQTIHGATDTTTGSAGFIASTARYNSIAIVCVVANTEYIIQSSQGSLTIN